MLKSSKKPLHRRIVVRAAGFTLTLFYAILATNLVQFRAVCKVFIAKLASTLSDVTLATILLSYKSKIEQL